MRMLVVDDEAEIADMLAEYFTLEGFEVTCANSGSEALAVVSRGFDIILLDVNMPGMDGFEVCRRIREHLSCPIMFLTARIEDVDQLDGFAAGADDYVLKPFSLPVLGRRVAAHMVREGRSRRDDLAVRFFGELTIDYGKRSVEVRRAGEPAVPVEFTRLEFDIVALLSRRAGQVFDRDAIYERVWGWDGTGDASLVRSRVVDIRTREQPAILIDACNRAPIDILHRLGRTDQRQAGRRCNKQIHRHADGKGHAERSGPPPRAHPLAQTRLLGPRRAALHRATHLYPTPHTVSMGSAETPAN